MRYLCVFVPLFLPVFAAAQRPKVRYDLPPAIPPSSCAYSLAHTGTLTGPPAYIRLAFQLSALRSAQVAVSSLVEGNTGLQTETTPAMAMSSLFTGTKQAHDALLCSASIMGKYKPVNEDDANARTLLIDAYNHEASAISDLEAHIKEQMLRGDKEKTQATTMKDAERITAMNAEQKEAGETIAQVTTFSLLMSVDTSNPDATDTRQTVLPCEEFNDLKKQSVALAHETNSAYTVAASFFVTFLEGHKCK